MLAASLGSLLLWVLLGGLVGDRVLTESLAYAVAPVILGVGVIAGRLCSRGDRRMLALAAAAALVATAVVVRPFYSNAEAATGIQLVSLAGLLLIGLVREPAGARAAQGMAALAAAAGTLGVLLAARSQAASLLVLLVAVAVAIALRGRIATSARVLLGAGLGVVAMAALAVVALGAAPVWPAWMNETQSLSEARHDLWADALALWREHPLLGGGPGSFFETSATARTEPHLYAAHSSLLQIASELGIVGVLLFGAVLVAGAVLAVSGDRAHGLIGVTAWCALAVHSMIDHLYEFPIVVLLAGVVIGWSGAGRGKGPAARSAAVDAPRRDHT